LRVFADEHERIKIHSGSELEILVGNIFNEFIVKRATLDVFYNLYLKGRDYAGSNLNRTKFDPTPLLKNTFQAEHKLGFNLSYHFDKNFRGEFGGVWTFHGRNAAETWQANAILKCEF
jgi:hypothetical protein